MPTGQPAEPTEPSHRAEVVVVGAGNAALCAALAAREQGAEVLVLERAPAAEAGGNSRFTAGAMRFVYSGIEDLLPLLDGYTRAELADTDFGAYTRAGFYDDMGRVTDYRCDPDLVETLVEGSYAALRWMHDQGVRFAPMYKRQAFRVDGVMKFWGGLALEARGGGEGLVSSLHAIAARAGVPVLTGHRATDLLVEDGAVKGLLAVHGRRRLRIDAGAVVLACGGFEADPAWRARYLGPGWDLAKVRGTRFNTGDGIAMALAAGAAPYGHWSGCHAVGWDYNAPPHGDLAVGDGFQKHSYPLGIMVNARGERFVDEGADFRNYTYARYGKVILEQPNQFAWQVFDAQVAPLLRDEYRIRQVTRVAADRIEELAPLLTGVDTQGFLRTVAAWNAAVDTAVAFNPAIRDGRRTRGLAIDKSNWANRLEQPPFEAYQVTCGITFTFGGLRVDPTAAVLDTEGVPIGGLYAAGELVGGLFYFNYPGGTGLTSGAVFGRLAGGGAARWALGER